MPLVSRPRRLAPWLALALLLVVATTASAHKIMLFAVVEGNAVTGYAYAPGGVRLPNNVITVFGPNDQRLGTTKTDAQGNFTYAPKSRCDLRFELNTGDGHLASYTIQAGELPPTLAGGQTATSATPPAAAPAAAPPTPPTQRHQATAPCPGGVGAHCPPNAPCRAGVNATVGDEQLATMVDRAVSRHVTPLREQLDDYEQKVRLHDVLGGIGYIIGLAGMAAYWLAKREKG